MATRLMREPAHTPRFKKPGPNRVPAYLAWVRTLPCSVCPARAPSEASHHGPRGIGQKASDLRAIPLCSVCHRDWHTYGHFDRVGYNTRAEARLFVAERALELHDVFFGPDGAGF